VAQDILLHEKIFFLIVVDVVSGKNDCFDLPCFFFIVLLILRETTDAAFNPKKPIHTHYFFISNLQSVT